jgi:predicted nucleic-acid-binding protein
MKRLLIDTNSLISFVTDRNPNQQKAVAHLFEAAARLHHEVICHQVVLIEFVYVLEKVYSLPKTEIKRLIEALVRMPGINFVNDADMKAVISIYPAPFSDFGDAVLAAYARQSTETGLFTFDRKFANAARKIGIPIYHTS